MRVTEESMWRGIAAAALGGHVGDISHAVRELRPRARATSGSSRTTPGTASARPCTSRPTCPTSAGPGKGARLVEGLALAVEPMVVAGEPWTARLDDDWTVATDDGSLAAHFEHTFTLTPRGAWVLTALDGGAGQARRARRPLRRPDP